MDQIKGKVPADVVGELSKLLDQLKGALAISIHNVFLAGAFVVAIALIFVFFLKEIPLRKTLKSGNKRYKIGHCKGVGSNWRR